MCVGAPSSLLEPHQSVTSSSPSSSSDVLASLEPADPDTEDDKKHKDEQDDDEEDDAALADARGLCETPQSVEDIIYLLFIY